VFLLDASSRLEGRVLERWIGEAKPEEDARYESIALRGGRERLEARIAQGDDPLFAPLRVIWLPKRRADGSRRVGWLSVLWGDPRDPGPLRQRWIAGRGSERIQIVAGDPAPLAELRERWRVAGGLDLDAEGGLADFVVRRAQLALERAERRVRGNRYKVPRLIREDIVARPAFRGAVARLAADLGRSEARVTRDAQRYLREIAAAHSPTMIDLSYQLFRFMCTRSYRRLSYDRSELEATVAQSQRYPLVFLPSHKSNLDHPALYSLLFENGLPPTHTAGGINMNFFPMGPVVRRSGVFFIRRSFRDNEVYKLVLRHYVDYLIEKRFSLEWYIEGGRSRSGKLLPPRFGLLAYVVDAYRRGKSEDVVLVPVSIAYDQIQDVGDYVAEQHGVKKQRESFRWLVGLLRKLRRFGEIEVRFGEPVSVAKMLGPPDPNAKPAPDENNLDLQKLAFEVCVRINRATPLTPTSLVTLALLGVGDRALSLGETRDALGDLLDYAERRELPGNGVQGLRSGQGVEVTLRELERSGVVTVFEEGREAVYRIGDEQHLAAAYYRNTVIHFFLTTAIAEIALLAAAEPEVTNRREAFVRESLAVRDLLKFEFFFSEREQFIRELEREMGLHDTRWEEALSGAATEVASLTRRLRPLAAHFVLRPFLEAYRILADVLRHSGVGEPESRERLVGDCLALGKQYTLQRRIRSAESVSRSIFETGLRLAAGRGLLGPDPSALPEKRTAFANELAKAVRRIDAVEAFAAARHVGVEV
jgi:glycerol-3-phosphate O-acyltransferase